MISTTESILKKKRIVFIEDQSFSSILRKKSFLVLLLREGIHLNVNSNQIISNCQI
jgi:hypothetical protein